MSSPVIQTSFSAGELSPQLFSRVDLAKYKVGAALLRNFFCDVRGGASTRPGTKFVARCLAGINRLIPFQFNTQQTYILVFSDHTLRFVSNGALVTETPFAIAAIGLTNPMQFNVPGNNFGVNDNVYVIGATGTTQVNQETYSVSSVAGPVITLSNLDGSPINATSFGAYTGGGTVGRLYTIGTPYAGVDLQLLKYAQSADVLTLTHPDYAPTDLIRRGATDWVLTPITFAATIQPPTGVVMQPLNVQTTVKLNFQYAITSIDDTTAEESQAVISPVVQNSFLDQTKGCSNKMVWTAATNASRYNLYKANPVADPENPTSVFGYIGQTNDPADLEFVDVNIAPDFTQTPPLHRDPFAGGNNPGVATYFQQRKVFAASSTQPETFWMTQTGVYNNMDVSIPVRDSDAITGTIASLQVNAIEFLVPMQSGLIALSSGGAWQISGGQPGVPITPTNAQAQPQAFNGCHFHVPPIPINYDILFVQTKGSVVRDLAYNFYLNVYTGTDLTVLSNHLFFGYQIEEWAYAEYPWKLVWAVRNDGIALSLAYLKEQDVYGWSHHDTAGRFKSVASIPETPNADPLTAEDVIYFVVERSIPGVNGGAPVQYIERLNGRNFTSGGVADVTKPWCVDCGLEYAGASPVATLTAAAREGAATIGLVLVTDGGMGYTAPIIAINDPTGTGATVTATVSGGVIISITTVTAGAGYTNPSVYISDPTGTGAVAWANILNDVLFTTDAAAFPSDAVGQTIRTSGGLATVTQFNSPTSVLANITLPITGDLQATAGTWAISHPVTTVGGLDHLNGAVVTILADGSVIEPQLVVNGSITLAQPAAYIIAGLPYVCQLKTLRLDTGDPTIQDKRKKLSRFTTRVVDTRGLKVGLSFDTLTPYKERNQSQPMGGPIPFVNSDEGMPLEPQWDAAGQVCIEQSNPLPATITGVVPWVSLGDTPG